MKFLTKMPTALLLSAGVLTLSLQIWNETELKGRKEKLAGESCVIPWIYNPPDGCGSALDRIGNPCTAAREGEEFVKRAFIGAGCADVKVIDGPGGQIRGREYTTLCPFGYIQRCTKRADGTFEWIGTDEKEPIQMEWIYYVEVLGICPTPAS